MCSIKDQSSGALERLISDLVNSFLLVLGMDKIAKIS